VPSNGDLLAKGTLSSLGKFDLAARSLGNPARPHKKEEGGEEEEEEEEEEGEDKTLDVLSREKTKGAPRETHSVQCSHFYTKK